jgi:peptide/nickel transport system permease protein
MRAHIRLLDSRAVRALVRDRRALVCLAVVLLYAITAALVGLGLLGADHDGRFAGNYAAPSVKSWQLWLGTDRQGRSILLRTLHSTRIAFGVGLLSALVSAFVGTLLGGIAGYFGRRVDALIVWLYSTVQSIPYLLLLIAITYAAGKGLASVCLAFCATFWAGPCRVVRAEVLRLRDSDFVAAAVLAGAGRWRILWRHILPNTLHLGLVYATLIFVTAIKSEVILSYLGLGVQGAPSWGTMINQARAELMSGFLWQIGAATVAMFGLVLSFNILAEALQDAFDPRRT